MFSADDDQQLLLIYCVSIPVMKIRAYNGTVPGKVLISSSYSLHSKLSVSWEHKHSNSGRKMSTMNLGSKLSLDKDSQRLSMIKSTTSLNIVDLEEVQGVKSRSEVKLESEARQKEIDHLITHANKVVSSCHRYKNN